MHIFRPLHILRDSTLRLLLRRPRESVVLEEATVGGADIGRPHAAVPALELDERIGIGSNGGGGGGEDSGVRGEMIGHDLCGLGAGIEEDVVVVVWVHGEADVGAVVELVKGEESRQIRGFTAGGGALVGGD